MDKTVKAATSIRGMGIGAKLSLGFGVVLALMLVILVVALMRLQSMIDTNQQMVDVHWRKSEAANIFVNTAAANARWASQQVMVTAVERKVLREDIMRARERLTQALEFLKSTPLTEAEQEKLQDFEQLRKEYAESLERYHQMLDDEWTAEAEMELKTQVLPILDELYSVAETIGAAVGSNVTEQAQAARSQAMQALWLVAAIGVAAILLGLFFSWRIKRSIVGPLHGAVEIAQAVAQGKLNQKIAVTSGDELGQLQQALSTMSTSLQRMVGEVRSSSDSIASASAQIATGNLDLSSRTEEQASALEQTSASMRELAMTVRNNYESSKHATVITEKASDLVTRSGAVVHEAVSTMQVINASSRKIADIIGIIDSIAFQTNILALNAAVEAARAGEQGRGFAVVASEVRALAGRSAGAAKEIKALIEESVHNVAAGRELVEKAGATMEEIVASVRDVAHIVSEISAASQEQTVGIEQINDAVAQMDSLTQHNAALVEEAASAAQSLQMQAQSLVRTVSVFRVAETDGGNDAITQIDSPALAPAGFAQKPVSHQVAVHTPAPAALPR